MEQLLKEAIKASVQNFRLPTYEEIPDVGLYLEQTAQYVADRLAPLQSVSITPSMVSNYVKQGLIESPVKKLYYRDQIAYLFFIAAAKTVLSLEDIQTLIRLQKQTYDTKTAYRYFSQEFENILFFYTIFDQYVLTGIHYCSSGRNVIHDNEYCIFHFQDIFCLTSY